jgi:DNA-binding NtrC family response regulator
MNKTNNVMVVDDDEQILDLVCGVVEKQGCGALCAKNAREAIEAFEVGRPFLTFTDLCLQNHVGGVNLAEKIKIRDPLCALVAMTGYAGDQFFEIGYVMRAVFSGFIVKPFSVEDLEKIIEFHAWQRNLWRKNLGV